MDDIPEIIFLNFTFIQCCYWRSVRPSFAKKLFFTSLVLSNKGEHVYLWVLKELPYSHLGFLVHIAILLWLTNRNFFL